MTEKGSRRPIVAKRSQSAKQVLYSVFFASIGPVVQIPTPHGRTINGHYYTNKVLKKVKAVYHKRRPKTGLRCVFLRHDNAATHKRRDVKAFLKKEKVTELEHPPYSPDLSPCDFFLFPRVKKMLAGRRYKKRSALGSALYQCLLCIPKTDYAAAFRSWIERLELCVKVKGDYFEGLNH